MNPYKFIIFIILIHLISLSLNANEKEIINNNLIKSLNYEIKPQFNFNFQNYKILNTGRNLDNDLINTKEYLKKARGFLAMGVTGVIFTGLALPVSISLGMLLLYKGIYFTIAYFATLFICGGFLGIGIPFLVLGFINYRKYKYQKNPDPFVNIDNNEKPYIIGLTFNLNKI